VWRGAAAVAAVVVLAACSGDDGGDGDASATTRGDRGVTTEAASDTDGGTIYDTVPAGEKQILAPVALDDVAEFGDGVTARLTGFEALDVEAFMPGEISGPGVSITVELTNGSTEPIDLGNVAVELVATGDRYATLITTQENTHLEGELAPGGTADGTYVFTIADEDRAAITVQVTYAAPKPTALFTGSLADV
jgi:hypothetical protein